MKFGSFIFLVFLSAIIYGQRTTNPFDIPQRGEKAADIVIPQASENIDTVQAAADSTNGINSSILQPISDPVVNNNPFELPQQSSQNKDVNLHPSISELKVSKTEGEPQNMKLIVLIYALVMMVILTLCISMDRNRFNSVLKSGINSNYLKTLYRDTKAWSHPQFIILYIFFFLNLGFLIWLILLKSSYIINLFILIGAVFVCYALRHFVMWVITAVYPVGREAELHNYSIAIHNSILGVLLLPVILVVEFVPGISINVLGCLAIIVFTLLYLLRQSKGLLSCLGMRGFNPIYFFVYLCAVEIAPILVGFKMMIGAL